jgi:hypothetical protein
LNFHPNDIVSVGANYGRDTYGSFQLSRNANPPPDPSFTDPSRDWTLDNDDEINTVNVYLDLLRAVRNRRTSAPRAETTGLFAAVAVENLAPPLEIPHAHRRRGAGKHAIVNLRGGQFVACFVRLCPAWPTHRRYSARSISPSLPARRSATPQPSRTISAHG